MSQLQSNASLVGIKLNLQPKLFNQVTAIGAPQLRGREHFLRLGHGAVGRRLVVRPRLLPDR